MITRTAVLQASLELKFTRVQSLTRNIISPTGNRAFYGRAQEGEDMDCARSTIVDSRNVVASLWASHFVEGLGSWLKITSDAV